MLMVVGATRVPQRGSSVKTHARTTALAEQRDIMVLVIFSQESVAPP